MNKEVTIYRQDDEDYICITDIAKYKNAENSDDLNRNRHRNKNTIEFLGLWGQLNNTGFKPIEFDGFKKWVTVINLQREKAFRNTFEVINLPFLYGARISGTISCASFSSSQKEKMS